MCLAHLKPPANRTFDQAKHKVDIGGIAWLLFGIGVMVGVAIQTCR